LTRPYSFNPSQVPTSKTGRPSKKSRIIYGETGVILEGPYKWPVRPVAEFFYEEEFGQAHTISALIGAIWQVRDNLSFDIGFRHAITNGTSVNEIRAGLTIGFPLRIFSPLRPLMALSRHP
jgi:hypothetical protein